MKYITLLLLLVINIVFVHSSSSSSSSVSSQSSVSIPDQKEGSAIVIPNLKYEELNKTFTLWGDNIGIEDFNSTNPFLIWIYNKGKNEFNSHWKYSNNSIFKNIPPPNIIIIEIGEKDYFLPLNAKEHKPEIKNLNKINKKLLITGLFFTYNVSEISITSDSEQCIVLNSSFGSIECTMENPTAFQLNSVALLVIGGDRGVSFKVDKINGSNYNNNNNGNGNNGNGNNTTGNNKNNSSKLIIGYTFECEATLGQKQDENIQLAMSIHIEFQRKSYYSQLVTRCGEYYEALKEEMVAIRNATYSVAEMIKLPFKSGKEFYKNLKYSITNSTSSTALARTKLYGPEGDLTFKSQTVSALLEA